LPKNGFGVSSGSALAEWLANEIDGVAGVTRPLTFGDLHEAGINLEMMTTNLTHGRPYRLPFEDRNHYFVADEMRALFPEPIVQWMLDHSETKRGSHVLPAGELPVVVATRMSLSFPLLLSAVPLWAIDYGSKAEPHQPERCWFSDGGITSNFPVHFFDAPIPRWPTFAINLAEHTPRYHAAGQRIYVPRTNRGGIMEWWTPFEDVAGFLKRIVSTMQNWRDNMLLHLPGQRDRIAHVLLADGEGGLIDDGSRDDRRRRESRRRGGARVPRRLPLGESQMGALPLLHERARRSAGIVGARIRRHDRAAGVPRSRFRTRPVAVVQDLPRGARVDARRVARVPRPRAAELRETPVPQTCAEAEGTAGAAAMPRT
jgi:predicted acylesterase/phospholipase RssA